MLKKLSLSLATTMFLFAADTKLNTTVISSTGYEEDLLKDEVKNVIVIEKEDIKNKGYRDIKEILEKVPSVSIVDMGFGPYIDMRGYGGKANTNVKFLINGIGLNTLETNHVQPIFNLVNVNDIEKIEIIPGGGSILYGSGTSGGIINIITKTSPQDFYANISTKIGSYNYKDLNLGVGGKVTDELFLKFNGKIFDTKGYRRDYQNKGYFFGGGLNYQISDNQNISFDGDYYNEKTKDVSSLTKAQVETDRRQSGNLKPVPFEISKRTSFMLNYALKDIDFVDLRITPYYQKLTFKDSYWLDEKKGINIKNRTDYGMGDLFYGYEFLINRGDTKTTKLKKTTNSIFILDKNNLTDFFSISIGGRYQHDNFDIKNRNLDDAKKMNNFAFEITPNFKYSDTGSVYARFDKGYVSPGANQSYNKTSALQTPPLHYYINDVKAEQFYTYELGIKDYISDVYFSATAFITDKKDEIDIQWIDGVHSRNAGFKYLNIDKTRRYGGELYSEQYILDGDLKFSESYSYVKPKIMSGENKGKDITSIPNHKLTLGVDYKIIEPLNIFGDFIYYSKMYDYEYARIKGHGVVNLGAGYDVYKGFIINAGIKNLLNTKYDIYSHPFADKFRPADERNYYVEFKYKY